MKNAGTFKVTTPTEREIAVTRVFDAPRHLVFDAMTKPELIKRWLNGPPGWSMVVCEMEAKVGGAEMEAKVGGAYRYLWHGPDGMEMGMRGVCLEMMPPERIVSTQWYDQAWYPGEAVSTLVLVEQGGQTTLTTTIRFDSQEIRDGVLKSPMEQGMAAGYNQLAELLASMAGGGEK